MIMQMQRQQVLESFRSRMGNGGGEKVLVYPDDGSPPIPSVLYLEG